jgi:hypothetical protein
LLLVPAASDRHPSTRRVRRGTALASLGLLAMLLVGCSAPGKVDDFNEDTQANFEQACKEANDDNLSAEEAERLCTCWYDAIVNGGMSFDAFEREDENIREAIDAGRFNNDDDFEREAPTLHKVVTENCQEQGPRAD